MSWGSTAMPPRRATVSAMRRPATAVMLATTIGRLVPMPSGRGQVDVEPRRHVGEARHHEHVVVGELERRRGVVEEAHRGGRRAAPGYRGRRWRYRPPATVPTVRSEPVVLVHGWGGSFATTWQAPGWEALLQDADRTVIGVDLLGHGTAPKPHDPAEYADLTTRIVDAIPADRPDRRHRLLDGRHHPARAGVRHAGAVRAPRRGRHRQERLRATTRSAARSSSTPSRDARPTTTPAACSPSTRSSRATTPPPSPP